jgi:nitrogen fixation protein FixH
MMSASKSTRSHNRTGEMTRRDRLIPWMFVAFFVVVAIVNVIMVIFALKSFTGISTENAYDKGLAYNQTLAAAQAQERLGWQVTLDFSARDRDHARLAVTLRDQSGSAITGASLAAHFIRPTREGFDSEIALQDVGAGRYEAQPVLALPGQWDMVVTANHDGASYQTTKRVYIPE